LISSVNNISSDAIGKTLSWIIKSFTWYLIPLPNAPLGWYTKKSSSVKPRFFSKQTANASPIANVAVVLAVGALPKGQASFSTEISK
jgi:hypothetical protein